ncbi:MAG: hypothetical protein K1X88_28570 [Nannocystaceae bacterium]|nr:hypothetical protein [Nannocystaceae bacterium]
MRSFALPLFACVLALAGCDKPSPSPSPTPPSGDGGAVGNDGGSAPTPASDDGGTTPAPDCGGKTCTEGRECVEYYGIAGPGGPKFSSCEWRCNKGQSCPEGTTCTTIADGPGAVCR